MLDLKIVYIQFTLNTSYSARSNSIWNIHFSFPLIAIILSQDPDNPNEDQDIASMSSPTYRDSYVKCQFEFWYYLAGNVGDAIFMPVLIHGSSDQGHTSYLDVFKPDSPKMGAWHRSVTGIGRQLGDFKMGFVLTPTDTYDAGVAIGIFKNYTLYRIKKF